MINNRKNTLSTPYKQAGTLSVILAIIMALGLCITGYFLYSTSEESASFSQQLDSAKRQLRSTKRDLRDTSSDLEDKESEFYSVNNQRDLLQSEVSTVKEKLSQTEAEKQQALNTLNSELAKAKQQLDLLQAERLAASKRLNGEMDTLKQQLAKTKQEKIAAQAQLKIEIDTIKNQLAQTEADKNQSQNALSTIRDELEAKLLVKENEYAKQIAQLNEFSSLINQKYEITKTQLDKELVRIAEFSATIETLEERLQREQTALNELTKQLALLDKKNAELSSEKSRLVQQFKDGTTLIRLEDTILFSSGSASLNTRGQKTLSLVADTLAEFPNHLISIEGHTDHRPITSTLAKKYPTNWELSAARASFAIRHLIEKGLPATQFQAVGFANTRPIALDTDYKSQKKNRRIEILLHPPAERVTITPAELMMRNKLSAK
ncbi:MAG: chemotaxis protein MotB [Candidatus Endobugula sp.]|jgi:chemotaxis protein MotB